MSDYEAAFWKLKNNWDASVRHYEERIDNLEAALRNISEGDIPRTVKKFFRDDRKPSKNDRCEHGRWMYEECWCCVEDYAREVLK